MDAKTQHLLISRIQSKLENFLQSLFRWVETKLRVIADREVLVLIYF
jgi:hypothetical protein